MASRFSTEIGPVTKDQMTLIVSDLNTTQIVTQTSFQDERAYIAFWAEGRPEANAAMSRATRNIAADFRIRLDFPRVRN